MDLAKENRLAAIIMKEAAELRRQAEKDGVNAYLRRPNVRGRPNARFLTATVLGVQQANRVVEVNEMWRVRQKELELEDRIRRGKRRDQNERDNDQRESSNSSRSLTKRHALIDNITSTSCRTMEEEENDEGLRDEELEEFLQSRVKRGRGAIGPRMDETGPYPNSDMPTSSDVVARRVAYGPERVSSRRSYESSEEEEVDSDDDYNDRRKRRKKKVSSEKYPSRKHRSKEKSSKKKNKKKAKRSKHHSVN